MRVRPYRPADAQALADLYRASVLELGARDYAPAQVAVWAGQGPSAQRLQALMADGRVRLVATDADDRPAAFGDLEPDGHVHFLYSAPEAAGTGAAAAVLSALEAQARVWDLTRLHAEASETALGFFQRHGFRATGRRDFEVAGVPIHNHAVEKSLT